MKHLLRIDDFARYRRRRNGERAAEIDIRLKTALAPLEITRGRGDAYLARGEKTDLWLAYAAAGCDHLRTRFDQLLDETGLETLQIHLLRSRRDQETDAFGDL